jgi:cephalosporin-C deacetylase-like acetyl esterase
MFAFLVRLVVGLTVVVPLLAWLFQDRLLFFPQPRESGLAARPNVEEVTIAAVDGTKLRGWFIKGVGSPAPLVIYFGGNAEEVSWLEGVADRFSGWSLLLMNYRGYGASEGKPGEKELFEDALAIHEYATRRPDVDPARIVAMGRSLGSGVAVHLAASRALRGVILVSPYDSMVEVARRHYPFLPVSLILRHRFDSLSRAPQIDAPMLCLVAMEDRIVPAAHARVLFDAWHGERTWREFAHADHDGISGESGYWSSIADFLRGLR